MIKTISLQTFCFCPFFSSCGNQMAHFDNGLAICCLLIGLFISYWRYLIYRKQEIEQRPQHLRHWGEREMHNFHILDCTVFERFRTAENTICIRAGFCLDYIPKMRNKHLSPTKFTSRAKVVRNLLEWTKDDAMSKWAAISALNVLLCTQKPISMSKHSIDIK